MEGAPSISESELKIMRILWSSEAPMMLSPLMEALAAQGNQWKANTVLTFLSRLSEKGMVRVGKVGRLNQYTACVDEAGYLTALTREFVSEVYGGDAKGLIASLLQNERLTPQDMAELQSFWKGARDDD